MQQQWPAHSQDSTSASSSASYPVGRLILATFVLMGAIGTEAVLLPVSTALVYVHAWTLLPLDLGLAGLAFVAGGIAVWWLARH